VKTIFKLKTRSTAILAKNDRRSAIAIPARAAVVLVVGDLYQDAFVKIRYQDKVLFMLSEDLRNGGELREERDNGSLSILECSQWRRFPKFWSLLETITSKSTAREGEGVVPSARE
jgi:hypothetical protein